MAGPVTVGAIDAGSNAIRAAVARATSPSSYEIIESERVAIRLGHLAFTRGVIDPAAIDDAVAAFSRFHKLFEHHNVVRYRAVATSASRTASNRDTLVRRLDHEAGIELEVIDGEEEARLVRKAIRHAFTDRRVPHLVLDLGGGSLEVGIRLAEGWESASLPVGTVRLMETLGLAGPIGDDESKMVRRHTATLLHTVVSSSIDTPLTPAAACGGNAEALASILGATDNQGMPVIEFDDLDAALPGILGADIGERMKKFAVKKDRAEVMAGAAIVFHTVLEELNLRRLLVPGVGIKDGVLLDLAEEVAPGAEARDNVLLNEARAFAHRVRHDTTHGEHVRKVARALFDQLGRVHGLSEELGVVLEIAALLHDIGEVVHRRAHHRHGEYIVRWARIPGLESPLREMVAALVRTHRKGPPDSKKHEIFASLSPDHQRETRKLAALLRLADALDTDRRQRVTHVRANVGDDTVRLEIRARDAHGGGIAEFALRKAQLFEQELGVGLECVVTGEPTDSPEP